MRAFKEWVLWASWAKNSMPLLAMSVAMLAIATVIGGCGGSSGGGAMPILTPSPTAAPSPVPSSGLQIPQSLLKVPVSRCAAHGEYSADAPCAVPAPQPGAPVPAATASPSVVPQWFQIVYAPTLRSRTPLVLNVANNTAAGAENIILWPQQPNSRNELWEYTQSGQFVSAVGDYWYNTFTSPKSPAQPMVISMVPDTGIVSEPSQAGTLEGGGDKFQQWNSTPVCPTAQCDRGAPIQNKLTGGYLYAPSGAEGTPVTLASTSQSQWVFWPPRTVQRILNQTNEPFPTFSGGERAAYDYISAKIGYGTNSCCYEGQGTQCTGGQSLTGVRCQYRSLDAGLATIQGNMNNLKQPSAVSTPDWRNTKLQLNTELTDADEVQSLYGQYDKFYTNVFLDNQDLLNLMISDASITAAEESTTMAQGKTIALLEGVLYTAIEGFGGLFSGGVAAGIGAIGNLMETGINGALASGTVSNQNFQTAVSTLWSQMLIDFDNIQIATSQNATSILEDWGRLKAVSALIRSTGPDSLALTETIEAQLETALQPGFEVAAMKILLPAKYALVPLPQTITENLIQYVADPPPSYDYLQTSFNGNDQTYNFSAITSGANEGHFVEPYPGQAAIQNDLLNNGVSQQALFNNLNGWTFPLSWTTWEAPIATPTGCESLLVSVINQTPNNLLLFLTGNHGSQFGDTLRSLLPYATEVVGLTGDGVHGPDFTFCVTNDGNSSCDNTSCAEEPCARFEVQQNNCVAAAGDITENVIESHVYESQELSQTTGSSADNIPGMSSVAIYVPSASQ